MLTPEIKSQLEKIAAQAKSVAFDSRKVQRGSVYVAIKGAKLDGHDFITQAIQSGAASLVVEEQTKVPASFFGKTLLVNDSRAALGFLAAAFYKNPSRDLFTVAVTGTNGKTTTTHLIEQILNSQDQLTGVIGTIDNHLGSKVWPAELTTPDPVQFQERLREFVSGGARAVALEASSIALTQSRIDDVEYNCAVFTNLSRDHLDYHSTMEDYFQAKLLLFTKLLKNSPKKNKSAIINGEDPHGEKIIQILKSDNSAKVLSYGFSEKYAIAAKIISRSFEGSRFTIKSPSEEAEMFLPMAGQHNIENAMAAIGAAISAGINLQDCTKALKNVRGVNGRLESVGNDKGIHVFVDYAHTDDALERAISSLVKVREEANLKSRIITVFGCGGDRDRGKRPLMMKAALKNSDYVVLTSDNPRTEDPQQIINDALQGVIDDQRKQKVHCEVDRRQAIHYALAMAQRGDVVIIAGKGHENYQQIGTQKHPFSDAQVVREFCEVK